MINKTLFAISRRRCLAEEIDRNVISNLKSRDSCKGEIIKFDYDFCIVKTLCLFFFRKGILSLSIIVLFLLVENIAKERKKCANVPL